jgi:hypothetical protein
MRNDGDRSPARMQRLDEPATAHGLPIDHAVAIDIARTHGVVTLLEIDRD